MSLPITFSLTTLEIKNVKLSDTAPTPTSGYEIILLKDLGYTKLWVEFKITNI